MGSADCSRSALGYSTKCNIQNKDTDRLPVGMTSSDEPKNQGERRLKIVSVRSEASFDDFSLSPACFSRLAGAVLTFFAYFFASRQKK
jgi:hypothetical protein